jgi:hypothetical protein
MLPLLTAHPGESRDPGQAQRLVLTWGCSRNSEQGSTRILGPGFRRDARMR